MTIIYACKYPDEIKSKRNEANYTYITKLEVYLPILYVTP